jgi:uncharacterized protein (TIGR04222 family)
MHPWGLSGPEFLWLYGVGLVAGLVVAIGVRMRVRRPRPAEPPAALDTAELGFLGGGPENAVAVAVARLAAAGIVRVNRSGEVSATSPVQPTGQPLDDAVLGELDRPRMVAALRRRSTVESATTAIGEALVRRGLLVSPAKAVRARLLGPVVLYVVFVVGIVRWVNGISNDLPVGYLTVLLFLTAVILVIVNVRAVGSPKARTVAGDRAVAAARAKGSDADPLQRVAVSGPRAHPDTDLSYALSIAAPAALTPVAWSYASSGSFHTHVPVISASGYSGGGHSCSASSSGGGSSCGGGGGGGCGGGSA